MSDSTTQSVLFPSLSSKPVHVVFDEAAMSSDGGGLLLQAVDDELGLTASLASCLRDSRQAGKVKHSLQETFAQRVFGIALGYPDANDSDALANDPIHKLMIGRDPIHGERLASQPTLSRMENAVSRGELLEMSKTVVKTVLKRHKRRLGRKAKKTKIILDFDPTVDPTHGQQQFTFFHGYYDTYCYLPLVGTVQFGNEKKQYLLCSVLRPGNSCAHAGFVATAGRILEEVLTQFPKSRIIVRLDGGFGAPVVLDFLEQAGVEFVVGLGNTKPLKLRAGKEMAQACQSFQATGLTQQVYGETLFKTKTTWPHQRRVIFKTEVVVHSDRKPKNNMRFVVTNLKMTPENTYKFYCQRGDAENRIKELKNGLAMDRTSCTSFLANQLRVLMTVAAYVLMQEIQIKARHSDCANAQVSTIRNRILKLAARVEVSARRVVIHMADRFPGMNAWLPVALTSGGHAP
jgi:hypothetical protein